MLQLPMARASAAMFAICVSGILGCSGQDGPTRYKVSGQVTINGKPAPVINILFRPDATKGGSGPGASAMGRDGRYETMRGVSTGPHLAEIVVFDGVPVSESSLGTALTKKPFIAPVVIPEQDSEQNFDVPAAHLVK